MKKLVLLTLIFLANITIAQETKVFELDLESPTKKSLKVAKDTIYKSNSLDIKTKQLIALKLVNANPFKYNYEINYELIDFFKEDLKSPFEKFETEIESASQPEKPEKEEMKNISQELKGGEQGASKEDEIRNIIEHLNSQKKLNIKILNKVEDKIFKENEKIIESLMLIENVKQIKKIEDRQVVKLKNHIKKIDSLTNYYESILDKEKTKQLDIKKQKKLEQQLRERTFKLKEKEEELSKKKISLALQIETEKMQDLYFKLDNYLQTIAAEDYLDKASFIKKRKTFNLNYQSITSNINKLSHRASTIKDFVTIYNGQLNYVKKIAEKIKVLLSKIVALKFDNYLHPIDFNGKNIDVIELTLKRYNKVLRKQEKDYTYTIWVKGGLKIDVSGGVYLTSLVDRNYGKTDVIVNENDVEVTRQVIHETNPGNYQYGFGSTINTSLRLGTSWVKPALSIGALFTNDQKFQLLAGAGVILGKKERIVLQFGLSMGQVSKIIDRYKADGITPYNFSSDDAIPTKQKFEFGHFFGISYNFGKIKSQNKKP